MWAAGAFAQDTAEVKAAMPVLLKVLTYDVNFDARGVGDFVVLVANEPGQAARREALVETLKTVDVAKVKARAVRYVGAEFKDEASLQGEIDRTHASALLATPGMSEKFVAHLSEVAQDNQLYAVALSAAMVEKSLPVGVVMTNGKPQIIINMKAAKGVGANFELSVLKLARVIQ
jgi:hypothetical protein